VKVFIWEDVLTDYTDGLAVAYAETLEEALALFHKYEAKALGAPTTVIDCATDKTPQMAYVWGGG